MKTLKTFIGAGFIWLATIIVCLGFILLTACGSISTVGNPDFELPTGQTAFYSSAVDTTPVIQATTSSASVSALHQPSSLTTDWTSGNPVYEIFNAFQDYQYPEDEGVIDVSNIYKLLFEAGTQYSTAIDTVAELTTPATITSPFDFGNTPRTYSYASDNYALEQDGDTTYALLTWIWDESPKMSYGVIEGSFNQTTGDLELHMVYLVDYESENDYCLRTYISGNEKTHQFTLKASKCGATEGSYAISIIGTGISESESADDYFLLKIIDNDNLAAYPEGRYYKFSSSADEDDLRAHPIDGFALAEVEDPNNYADTLDTLTFFALDGTDHATSVDDFSNSSLTLDF